MKHSNDDMMTEVELAQFLRVSRRCVQNWRVRGGGPRYVEISRRCIRYPKREVLAWLDARTRAHTSAETQTANASSAELSGTGPTAASETSEACDAEPPLPLQLAPAAIGSAAEPRSVPKSAKRLRTLLPHDRD